MAWFLAFVVVVGGGAAVFASSQAQSKVLDDEGTYRCDWNSLGRLGPLSSGGKCSPPFDPDTASGPLDWSPWTHKPVCTRSNTTSRYCAFVKDHFRGESSMLLLTSPDIAAGDFSIIQDFDPRWVDLGPSSPSAPETPPFEIQEIPGKGLGAVATSRIHAGGLILREHPRLMQIVSKEMFEVLHRGEALWILEEGFVRLPMKDQVEVFGLARSTGGHVLEDIIRTNTFGVTFNNVSHYGLFPKVARINHACRPNSITRFSSKSLTLEVVAYRDIQPGEELTISYSPLNMNYKDRQMTLKEWGFECNCSLCSSANAVAASDARRGRIQEIVSVLNNPVFHKSRAMLARLAREVEEISEKERLEAQLGDFYDMFARAYVLVGEVETGRRYAELAVEKLVHFAGYDDERTEKARGLLGELGKVGGA